MPWKEIVKAFEYKKGSYVVLEPDDIKSAASEGLEVVEVRAFVDADAIGPDMPRTAFRHAGGSPLPRLVIEPSTSFARLWGRLGLGSKRGSLESLFDHRVDFYPTAPPARPRGTRGKRVSVSPSVQPRRSSGAWSSPTPCPG